MKHTRLSFITTLTAFMATPLLLSCSRTNDREVRDWTPPSQVLTNPGDVTPLLPATFDRGPVPGMDPLFPHRPVPLAPANTVSEVGETGPSVETTSSEEEELPEDGKLLLPGEMGGSTIIDRSPLDTGL